MNDKEKIYEIKEILTIEAIPYEILWFLESRFDSKTCRYPRTWNNTKIEFINDKIVYKTKDGTIYVKGEGSLDCGVWEHILTIVGKYEKEKNKFCVYGFIHEKEKKENVDIPKSKRMRNERFIKQSDIEKKLIDNDVEQKDFFSGFEPFPRQRICIDRITSTSILYSSIDLCQKIGNVLSTGKKTNENVESVMHDISLKEIFSEWRQGRSARGNIFASGLSMAIAASIYDTSMWRTHSYAVQLISGAIARLVGLDDDNTLLCSILEPDHTFRLPHLGVCTIFCYERNGTLRHFVDGSRVDPSLTEYRIMRNTIEMSRLRNNHGDERYKKTTYLFCVPAYPAVTLRAMTPCNVGCSIDKSCIHRRLLVYDKKTWITAQDVLAMNSISSKLEFDRIVSTTILEIGAECVSYLHACTQSSVITTRLIGEIYRRMSVGKMKIVDTLPKISENIMNVITQSTLAETRLRNRFGYSILEISQYIQKCHTLDFCRKITNVEINGIFNSGTTFHGSIKQNQTGEIARLPGYILLQSQKWDIKALEKYLPPCLRKIVEECTTRRHPKYPERMLMGTFLAEIKQLTDDNNEFYSTWKTLFEHPEEGSNASSRLPGFDASKYGKRCAENILTFVKSGKTYGCNAARKYELCPFATESCKCCAFDLSNRIGMSVTGIYSPRTYYQKMWEHLNNCKK